MFSTSNLVQYRSILLVEIVRSLDVVTDTNGSVIERGGDRPAPDRGHVGVVGGACDVGDAERQRPCPRSRPCVVVQPDFAGVGVAEHATGAGREHDPRR